MPSVRKVIGATRGEQDDRVAVCMVLFDPERQTEREVTLQIPLTEKERWVVDDFRTSDNIRRTTIQYLPELSDLKPGCVTNKARMAVLQFDEKEFAEGTETQYVKLNDKLTEAAYVVNRDGTPVHVGYVSTKPIAGNGYAISVPIYMQFHYPVRRDSKPYLYVFTPVTVTLDIATGVAALLVAAPMCGDANRGCFGK